VVIVHGRSWHEGHFIPIFFKCYILPPSQHDTQFIYKDIAVSMVDRCVCRPDCSEDINRCSAADEGETFTFNASAVREQPAVFDRGDAKRAGVRRALTVCRTAL